MDVLQMSAAATPGIQGVQSTLQPPSVQGTVGKMASAIDDAVATGRMSESKAAPLMAKLDGIGKALSQGVPADGRGEIGKQLREVGKELNSLTAEPKKSAAKPGPTMSSAEASAKKPADISPPYGSDGKTGQAPSSPGSNFTLWA